ncbi:MAG: FAD-dependent monooxygenase, partial [Polyangia bacterium]
MELHTAPRYDVIVVGGGLSGCAMATALADGRRTILVLEARAGRNPRFNGELIHPHGVDVLDERGFLAPLHKAGGADVRGFAVVKSLTEPTTLLPYDEIPGSRPFGFAIDHHDLVDVMRARTLAQPGVELRLGERVVDLVRDQERVIGVMTSTGPALAPVIIACDGRHSKIRALIEMPEHARLLSFTAAALLQDCPLPQPGFGHIFLGAWGPILLYPIGPKDARTCIDLPQDMDKGKDAVIARIRRDYAQHLPEGVRATLVKALDGGDIEVAANYAIYTDECTVPGAALVGDSAGCSHPLTATGMTIALNDTRLLAAELAAVADLEDRTQVDRALAKYQTERYRFVRAREILADALYEVFRGT